MFQILIALAWMLFWPLFRYENAAACAAGNPDSCTVLIESGHESTQQLAIDYYNRGLGSGRKGHNDLAIADYTKAIEINPDLALAYSNRSFTYVKLGRFDDAIADGTKAIALTPNFALAYTNRAAAENAIGRREEALADATKAIALQLRSRPGVFHARHRL